MEQKIVSRKSDHYIRKPVFLTRFGIVVNFLFPKGSIMTTIKMVSQIEFQKCRLGNAFACSFPTGLSEGDNSKVHIIFNTMLDLIYCTFYKLLQEKNVL